MAEPNITAIKRKTATQYLFFMLGCYYLVFFTSFLLSLLFINQIIGKFNTGITILILIGFLMLLFIIIGVVIVRFYTSIHTEKWGNLTDKPLFFSSIILFSEGGGDGAVVVEGGANDVVCRIGDLLQGAVRLEVIYPRP